MTGVAAHLIVGAREEPFLPALLASLDGVADVLLVNDNARETGGPNARVLAASAFARDGRMIVDRAPFENFAAARNRVLDLHRAHDAGPWAAFVDADEVHGPAARTIARNLAAVPPDVAEIDGYTRHFLQTFHWYTSIDRRTSFFRVTRDVRWENPVHEVLRGLPGRALAIPYVYDHYGWVLPMRHQAEKGRLYAGLGQIGQTHDDAELATLDPVRFFAVLWPRAIRYRGTHTAAAREVEAELERRAPGRSAEADALIARSHAPAMRARSALRAAHYAIRWRARSLDPLARRVLAPCSSGEGSLPVRRGA